MGGEELSGPVDANVLTMVESLQVLDGVVIFVLVDVVDIFARFQESPEFDFHEDTMKGIEALGVCLWVLGLGPTVAVSTALADRLNPKQGIRSHGSIRPVGQHQLVGLSARRQKVQRFWNTRKCNADARFMQQQNRDFPNLVLSGNPS